MEEAIDRLLKAYRLSDKMIELDIIKAWPEVMGDMIAGKTIDIYVKNKVLYVKLDSSTLREELSYGKSKLIKNINEHIKQEFLKDVVLK